MDKCLNTGVIVLIMTVLLLNGLVKAQENKSEIFQKRIFGPISVKFMPNYSIRRIQKLMKNNLHSTTITARTKTQFSDELMRQKLATIASFYYMG